MTEALSMLEGNSLQKLVSTKRSTFMSLLARQGGSAKGQSLFQDHERPFPTLFVVVLGVEFMVYHARYPSGSKKRAAYAAIATARVRHPHREPEQLRPLTP